MAAKKQTFIKERGIFSHRSNKIIVFLDVPGHAVYPGITKAANVCRPGTAVRFAKTIAFARRRVYLRFAGLLVESRGGYVNMFPHSRICCKQE